MEVVFRINSPGFLKDIPKTAFLCNLNLLSQFPFLKVESTETNSLIGHYFEGDIRSTCKAPAT